MDRTSIARTWAERAQAELGAAQRFRALAAALPALDVSPQLISLALSAAVDEDEHAYLCANMARELGHSTGFEALNHPGRVEMRSWHQRADDGERVLLDVVLQCCITESMNATLLTAIYEHAHASSARDLIRQILKDEVKHGQLGWAILHDVSERMDLALVSEYLAEMLSLAVRDELFLPSLEASECNTYAVGVMPRQHRLEHFCEALEAVLKPGFEHFGIETSGIDQWLDSRRGLVS